LFAYLEATNRTDIFGEDEPLWLGHDKGASSTKKKGLTSHGFARRMETYAIEAGIRHFHIHRLRHTFAKIVSEYSESMAETQEALGHSNIKTTQIYVQRLAVKKINIRSQFATLCKNDSVFVQFSPKNLKFRG
jgi:site-specific recombinase XerD